MDDKNDIHDDNLDDLAPHLSNLRKDELFGVPGDYFDALASQIQDKIADAEELREIAPLLSEIPKYNPFAVPDGYFDELPSKIQERAIAARGASLAGRLAWLFRPRFAIAAMAIGALIVAFFVWNNNTSSEVKTDAPLANNTPAADSFFVNEDEVLNNVDESALIESYSDDEQVAEAATDNSEEIVSYLVDNNIDVSSIVNEL